MGPVEMTELREQEIVMSPADMDRLIEQRIAAESNGDADGAVAMYTDGPDILALVRRRRVPRPRFRVDFPEPRTWPKLRTEGCVADVRSLLAGIDAALPRHTIMFLEGTSMLPEVNALLADRSVEPLRDDLRATIWPRSDRFHIPVTDENLADLRGLAERYETWEICEHITVYDGYRILLSAHDIGDRVLLSADLSQETRERFRTASRAPA